MFVVDINLIKHVKLSTLYTAKLRCRQQIYLPYEFENIVAYCVTYNKFYYSYDELYMSLQTLYFSLMQFTKDNF